jgi:endonuclease YncB( thermonuclease family)
LVNNWCDTPREGVVAQITDGDTLVLDDGEIIRLLGIDAPEVYYSGHSDCASAESTDCCYGDQATQELENMAPPGTILRLEFDLECTGVYERTLAYLFVLSPDTGVEEIFLNEWLLEDGHAKVYSGDVGHAQDIRYLERFHAAQAKAQSAKKGLWNLCF